MRKDEGDEANWIETSASVFEVMCPRCAAHADQPCRFEHPRFCAERLELAVHTRVRRRRRITNPG